MNVLLSGPGVFVCGLSLGRKQLECVDGPSVLSSALFVFGVYVVYKVNVAEEFLEPSGMEWNGLDG